METTLKGAPTNSKSLAAFLFNQMLLLDDDKITPEKACAQAKLASQINNLFDHELKRTLVEIKLKELGSNIEPRLRQIESKAFDDTV